MPEPERSHDASRDVAQAQDSLTESEARFHRLMDSIPQIVWIVDGSGRTEFFNQQWMNFTGTSAIPPTAAQIAEQFVHPDDHTRTMEAFAEAIRTQTTFRVEHRMRAASGEYRWFLVRAEPERDMDTGRITRWLGTSTDIHEQKVAEEALRRLSERDAFLLALSDRLRPLANPVEIQYEASRVLGEYLGANRIGYAEDMGDGEHILVTRDYTNGVPGIEGTYRYDDYGPELLRAFRAGHTVVRPDIANDPSLTPAEKEAHHSLLLGATVNIPLVKAGHLVAVLFIHFQEAHAWSPEEVAVGLETAERIWAAVERARAEEKLREREAELARVQRIGGVGGVDIDVASGLTGKRSPEYQRLHGLLPGTEYETHDDWLKRVHPEDREQAEQTLVEALAGTGNRYESDYRIHRPVDGQERWISARLTIERDRSGRPVRMVGAHIDITDRKQIEQALRTAEARFRRLSESGLMGIAYFTTNGEITEANDTFLEMIGYSRDELQSGLIRWDQLTPPEWIPQTRAAVEGFREAGIIAPYEKEYFRRTGERFWGIFGGARINDSGAGISFILDITQRKRAEIAYRESEAKYRTLFDSMDEGFCIIEMLFDANGKACDYRILEANPAFEKQTGLFDAIGKTVSEIAPDLEAHWFEIYGNIALTGEPARFENNAATLGHYYDVYAFRVGEPEQHRVAVLFNDIGERKRAESALRASEEQLRALFNQATVGIVQGDADGNFHRINQRYADILGYSHEELFHKNLRDITYAEDLPRNEVLYKRAVMTGEPFEIEKRYCRKDGSLIWVYNHVTPILNTDGILQTMLAVCIDITQRKQAEDALRQSEGQLSAIFARAAVGLSEIGLDGRFQRVNDELCRLLKRSREEMLTLRFSDITHPDDLSPTLDLVARVTTTGIPATLDKRCLRSDGSTVWTNSNVTLLRDNTGTPYAFLVVTTDLTQRKQAEEAILQSLETVAQAKSELEQRVEERTQELALMSAMRQELLRQLVTAQEQERARISRDLHDDTGQQVTALLLGLRNLKTMPSVSADLAAQAALTDVEKLAGDIAQKSHRLSFTLRPTALDDMGLVAALQNYVAEWSRWSQVPVEIESVGLEDGQRLPSEIETTIYRVAQEALTNVLRHAVMTTRKIASKRPRTRQRLLKADQVSIVIQRMPGNVLVTIEDNGPGFDVDTVMTQPPGKRRLGIFGMQERARLTGGTLTIESEPGQGTTLYLRLPNPETGPTKSS